MPKIRQGAVMGLTLMALLVVQPSPSQSITLAAPIDHSPTSSFSLVNSHLPGISNGYAVWGDYDNDGALDVALAGTTRPTVLTATIYRGDSAGSYIQNPNTTFTPTGLSNLAWSDYNNDGNLDLLQTGDDVHDIYVASVYSGDGQGHFPEDLAAQLPVMIGGSVAWGDYNHDGSRDLMMSGGFLDGTGSGTRTFAGDGQGHFPFNPQLNAPDTGQVAWGDYNNDGNLDFVLATDLNFAVYVYQGNGQGGFTLVPNLNLPEIHLSCAAWGDYNNDGNLDLIVSGRTVDSQHITRLYQGDGHGGFTLDAGANIAGTEQGSTAWGDYNNDGNLDLLLTGFAEISGQTTMVTKVYSGDGAGGFSEDATPLLGVVGRGAWGDFNNDGKLDILASGGSSAGITTTVYRNDLSGPANQPPSSPSGLSASLLTSDSVSLSWQAASDDHTPAATLSYNLRVGTTPGASNIVAPMADTQTGQRRIQELGNAQLNRHYTLSHLQPGQTYYWSVQAIDNSWHGGPFAAEGSFTLDALGTPTAIPPTATASPTANQPTPSNTPTIASTNTPTNIPTSTPTPLASNTPLANTPTATDTPAPVASATPSDCANPFTDISGNVFYAAIHYLNCRGVVNGQDPTHYGPAGSSTRAQFAKVVVLGFGVTSYTPATPTFSDVPTSHFAYVFIEAGYHQGILSGYDSATCGNAGVQFPCYLPGRAISRAELTKLVVGAAQYPPFTPTQPSFSDVPPSNIFYASIETAHHKAVINGYPDNTFRPNNNIRRDEMAQIVYKGVTTP